MSRLLQASVSVSAPAARPVCAADFTGTPTIGPAQMANDDSSDRRAVAAGPGAFFRHSRRHVPGVARTGGRGSVLVSSNAISKLLGGPQNASCSSTNPVVRSLAAGGPASNAAAAQNAGSEVLYAGMAGTLDGGGSFGGHLFSTRDSQHRGQYDSVDRSRNIAGHEWSGRRASTPEASIFPRLRRTRTMLPARRSTPR